MEQGHCVVASSSTTFKVVPLRVPKVLSSKVPLGQSVQSQVLRAWKLGLHTGPQVASMTWMPTWQHFWEVRLGTCLESWVEQKS
jgi:hypothetical protein